MLSELMSALTVSNTASGRPSDDGQLPSPQQERGFNTTSTSQVSETFLIVSGNATKFLSSQIPQFGGIEGDNVEIWLEKLESVAEVHNMPQPVIFSAAISRLTKTARR